MVVCPYCTSGYHNAIVHSRVLGQGCHGVELLCLHCKGSGELTEENEKAIRLRLASAKHLREKRLRSMVGIRDMADKCNVRPSQISMWENGIEPCPEEAFEIFMSLVPRKPSSEAAEAALYRNLRSNGLGQWIYEPDRPTDLKWVFRHAGALVAGIGLLTDEAMIAAAITEGHKP